MRLVPPNGPALAAAAAAAATATAGAGAGAAAGADEVSARGEVDGGALLGLSAEDLKTRYHMSRTALAKA